jgi:hypothetical protein
MNLAQNPADKLNLIFSGRVLFLSQRFRFGFVAAAGKLAFSAGDLCLAGLVRKLAGGGLCLELF